MPRSFRLAALALLALGACRGREVEPAGPFGDGLGGDGSGRDGSGGDPARGFALLAERGCTACHAAPGLAPEPAPRLAQVGARLSPAALDSALSGGARMPDCLPAGDGRAEARAALTQVLASRGGPLEREPLLVDVQTLERGRQLYHSVGCVACHAPFEPAASLTRALWDFPESFEPSPAASFQVAMPRDPLELRGLAARTSLGALARYLADPLAVHPAGRMPALALDAREAHAVAAYLLYEDELARGGTRFVHGRGLQLEVFEGSFPGETAELDGLTPVHTGTATSFFEGLEHRDDDFAMRFRGFLYVPEDGEYWFATRSDDGSMLYVNGALVVDNRGQHGMEERTGRVRLARGRHAFELTYFEHMGDAGLEVSWHGPVGAKQPLAFDHLSHLVVGLPERPAETPFVLAPDLVARGESLYAELGCASCHDGGAAQAAPLTELDPRRGCLAPEAAGAAPRHRLAPEERADLAAALRAKTPPNRTAAARLAHELARLNCGACHAREELTGPSDALRPYFQVDSGLDLGDQGRFPPALERAGAKLKPAWFHAVLAEGGRARPYMKTRMPQFGAANVSALPELFAAADVELRDEREPAFSSEAVEAGKRLAGLSGLGCIQCHDFAGHPSIGIPAVDLAKVHERVYPGWFRELLMDPVAIGMNTRMPSFWVDGRSPVHDVLGGDPAQQVDALWTYLSLGSSMPLPHGLVPREGEYEVEVFDEPVCVGVFMKGVSPRTVAVGLPERVHYAFDVENSRLALAWRGRFFDARGTWHGRAGQLEKPAGEDVLEFPAGPSVARLDDPAAPWPRAWPAEHRGLGWTLDEARRPEFRHALGDLTVTERMTAVIRSGGAVLEREWRLHAPKYPVVSVRLAQGDEIQRLDDKTWQVRGSRPYQVRIVRGGGSIVVVPNGAGESELRARFKVGIDFALVQASRQEAESSRVAVEYAW